MDIGTGIVIGCAILGMIIGMIRLFPNKKNNPNKYVSQKLFDILNQTMRDGFQDLKEDIKGIHQRIGKILEK